MVIDSKYKVVRLIGEGGMGAVYLVHHLLLQKDMALKTFLSQDLSPEAWQRFQREAQAIARLKHRNIVEVFDFGVMEGRLPYYTMSLLEGESLAERLKRVGLMEPSEALTIFLQVAEALAHAHHHNIVHRDIKPANIFLEKSALKNGGPPQVRIVDFGIAKLAEDKSADESQALTTVGTIFGSPLYMSPEQSQGLPVDHRSDIYSFGCALFEALTGAPPFIGENAFATLMCHQNNKPARLRSVLPEADLPQRLDNLVASLLAKKPEERYQTFLEVIDELHYCLVALVENQKIPASEKTGGEGTNVPRSQAQKVGIVIALVVCASLACLIAVTVLRHLNRASDKFDFSAPLPVTEASQKDDRETAAADPTPFLVSRGKDGERTFIFPKYASIGYFTIGEHGPHGKRYDCRGRLLVPPVPPDRDLIFHPTGECCVEPKLFERFHVNDFEGLHLENNPMKEWGSQQFASIYHLTNVRFLCVERAELDNDAVACFEKFPNLTTLIASGSNLKGQELARPKLLAQLLTLRADHCENMSAFIDQAAKPDSHCRLQRLSLARCDLNDADVKTIAKIRTLETLLIGGNHFHGSGLADLVKLPKLSDLRIQDNNIEMHYLGCLRQMKGLRTLWLSPGGLTEDARQRFEASLRRDHPNCDIVLNKAQK